jgi:hypothetical protein
MNMRGNAAVGMGDEQLNLKSQMSIQNDSHIVADAGIEIDRRSENAVVDPPILEFVSSSITAALAGTLTVPRDIPVNRIWEREAAVQVRRHFCPPRCDQRNEQRVGYDRKFPHGGCLPWASQITRL